MRVFHVLTEGGELCRKKETWPMEEGDWVERLFFVHPSLQQLLATAVMRQIVCIMSAVAAPGVSGTPGDAACQWWLPRRQQRELAYCCVWTVAGGGH